MDAGLVGIATAVALASSAGLNTTMPLLIVAVLARFGNVHLTAGYQHDLTTNTTIGILAVLAIVELAGDKIPAIDSVLHVVQWPLASASGAVLFASQHSSLYATSPALAFGVGLLIAATVHGGRTTVRPVVTGTTMGFGNPVVSAVEDAIAVVLVSLAFASPVVALVLAVILLLAMVFVGQWAIRKGAAAFGRWRRPRATP